MGKMLHPEHPLGAAPTNITCLPGNPSGVLARAGMLHPEHPLGAVLPILPV